jgi:hypothetical protein
MAIWASATGVSEIIGRPSSETLDAAVVRAIRFTP